MRASPRVRKRPSSHTAVTRALHTGLIKRVGSSVVAKVSDFGIARTLNESTLGQTQTHAKGSVHWMSPEAFEGHHTCASDVWSFAMTLYELLTRRLPFEGKAPTAVMRAVCVDDTRPDVAESSADGSLSVIANDPLIALMRQCWATDPFDRPSFGEIVSRLNELAPTREITCVRTRRAREHITRLTMPPNARDRYERMLTKLTQRIKDEEEKVEREFDAAWEQLAPDGGERLLQVAAALATELEAALPESTRQPACADAHTLHADALATAPELLRAMREFVEDAGGVFEMPPPIGEIARGAPFADDVDTLERVVKSLERVVEKADSDYAGDHTRVIDLVRATGRFDTPTRLADALEVLLDPPGDGDAPAMRVVRCKDKFNNPRDGCVMRLASACATR